MYSHLVGAGIFMVIPHVLRGSTPVSNTFAQSTDFIVLSIYCYSVATCFICSTMWVSLARIVNSERLTNSSFHLLENHSAAVALLCNKLDYLGILILMWGAMVSTIHFGIPCDQHLRVFYWIMVSPPLQSQLYT